MRFITFLIVVVGLVSLTQGGGSRQRRQIQRILPPIKKLAHGVSSGNIILLDSKRILIKSLRYDGAGNTFLILDKLFV